MKKSREGFTLVELSFSMIFIGVLSISVVLIISNTVAAYQRGITLNRVNNVGTDLSDDMRTSIQGSSARALSNICTLAKYREGAGGGSENYLQSAAVNNCESNNGYNYIYVVKKENVSINNTVQKDVPIYGAFCTGSYSYMWNSGYYRAGNATFESKTSNIWATLSYLSKEDAQTKTSYNGGNYFRLIKVQDESREICMTMMGREYKEVSNEADLSTIGNGTLRGEVVNLLPEDGGNDLALYDLFVAPPAASADNENLFYSVSMILGTVAGGIDIMAKGNSCASPQGLVSDNYNYCAINKFNFAIQVNGG